MTPPWPSSYVVSMPTFVELLTAAEVAEEAGVSARTIWRWEREGILSAVRMRGAVRFERNEVDMFLARRAAS